MNSTLQYLQTVLATNYPGLDVSAGSPLSELFLNPTAAMLDPVMTQLKYLLDNLGILNPENINNESKRAVLIERMRQETERLNNLIAELPQIIESEK